LQGIQLDARSLSTDGSWSMLLFNRFVVRVTPTTTTTSSSEGLMDAAVSVHTSGFETSQLARTLLPLIGER
jgi:hypothetical protein